MADIDGCPQVKRAKACLNFLTRIDAVHLVMMKAVFQQCTFLRYYCAAGAKYARTC